MATTAECAVDIDAVRSYCQSVQCFLQQDGHMIGIVLPTPALYGAAILPCICACHRDSPPGFITCLARLLNASGEKDSKN
jgi:hypothetical protein